MAKFYLRTQKTDGESNLYIDVNRPKYGIRWKVNTRIRVSVSAWTKAQATAKSLIKYFSTEEGKAVQEKTDLCEKVIKAYFDNIKSAAEADKTELESQINDIVNTDINEKREALEELRIDESKVKAEKELHRLGEVLSYYESFFN